MPLSLTRNATEDEEGQIEIPVDAEDRKIGDLLALRQMMAQLPKEDRMLLELRYFREMTQTKTAEILQISQVQVSRKEKKLLSKLREALLE